ncbi:hypothetical protein BDQ17DRAFT_1253671, partial [Cyathus striatus]
SARNQSLISTDNTTGHTFIKVDNTSNINSTDMINGSVSRNSVKIMTKTAFPMGSVWLIDIFHIPYGVSSSW